MNLSDFFFQSPSGWHSPFDVQKKPAVQQMLFSAKGLQGTSFDRDPLGVQQSPRTSAKKTK
jgi:hypothetical protein